MTVTPLARALRNNNPGNIERNRTVWAGMMMPFQMTDDQRAEKRFVVFATPVFGFRALAMVMHTYKEAHGCDTISKIVTRYAPSVENATDAYIAHVALEMNVDPDAVLDLDDPDVMADLCKAIARHESGGWFFDDVDLNAGVAMALHPVVKEVPIA